jgi:hypothetical protein
MCVLLRMLASWESGSIEYELVVNSFHFFYFMFLLEMEMGWWCMSNNSLCVACDVACESRTDDSQFGKGRRHTLAVPVLRMRVC